MIVIPWYNLEQLSRSWELREHGDPDYAKKASRLALRSLIPILQWLPNYNRVWLRGVIIAGLTVVALLVPEGMAYAELAGLLRLGRIAQFFSESVLTGFVYGLALVIIIKQVPKIFGLEAADGNFWQRLYDLVININETHLLTLVVDGTTLLLMIILEHRFHRVPAALIALVYGILIVTIFNLDARGVHIVGEIPAGLAHPKLPDVSLSQIVALVPGELGISLVMFAEAISPTRSFASKHRYRINDDQELIGLDAANLGAGIFQGFSIGASLSKSAANDDAGA